MVPYVPRGLGQDSTATVENHDKHPRFSLFGQHNHQLLRASSVPRHVLVSEADPSRGVGSQLLRASSVPRHILVSEAGPSRGVGSDGPVFELGPVPPLVSLLSTRFRAFRLQIKRTRGASHTHTFVYLDDPRIRGPSSLQLLPLKRRCQSTIDLTLTQANVPSFIITYSTTQLNKPAWPAVDFA